MRSIAMSPLGDSALLGAKGAKRIGNPKAAEEGESPDDRYE